MFSEKFSLIDFFKKNLLPLLLIVSIFASVIYIYSLSDALVYTVAFIFSVLFFIVLFLIEDMLERIKKGWIKAVGVVAAGFIITSLSPVALETVPSETMKWFLDPKSFSEAYLGNIIFIILLFGFIIGSALFYFTRIHFRAVYVFLICMCPFALFAKTFTDIPVIFTILIVTLFFLLIILNQNEKFIFIGNNRYAAVGAFIVFISIAAAFMPKLEFAPYREEFDEAITGINISAGSATDFNMFGESSSQNRSEDDEKILYTFSGDNPVFVKRQCFNLYDAESDVWTYYGDDTGYNYYSDYMSWEDPSRLAAECGLEHDTVEKSAVISCSEGNILAYYTHENTTSFEVPYSSLIDYPQKKIYRNRFDEYFSAKGQESYNMYLLNWCDFDIDIEFMLYYTDEKARSIDKPYSRNYLKAKTEMIENMKYVMDEEIRRSSFRNNKSYEEIKTLTNEITKNCFNDYEKAFAIEQYFKSSEFSYDRDFVPSDGSVENFLFNTRRGICTDYATAMTLMCREAGLYARYVEGFLVQNIDSEGRYVVTAADGHAYVQVWLDGYGWTDFDPTSTNIYEGGFDMTFLIFGIAMLLIAAGGIFVFAIRPVLNERSFIKKMSAMRGREQLLILYPKISGIVHSEHRIKADTLTVNELRELVKSSYALDISSFSEDFEAAAYGDAEFNGNDYSSYYSTLKKVIKDKKKKEQKERRKR